ncbi:protein of unknown function DUF378 [Desulfofarcimen acetoxidans DSM 771]|jgi:uncharacterized membrane protein YuzA (DUF378 family)|uniref:DUF378 domain-containing protein n=1 Tax=Desulfofarcimen acetoxidans (strain ATCC 49208 / DSM 771 / KCTC 5769 / VKM B-1644 / 5575) TaxID=485916 RepID=C8W228_DESAS|nr:DUF378 domain-containing protein [Desulfofarcimen acetoxidans]ACV61692.1 protein of unknown function DUF378 [Desulfofarcimen acetoxidans DSM 771]
MDWLSRAALVLVIIGAINWLLVGVFQWDLVTAIFGGDTVRTASGFSRAIYSLVGLAGLYSISFFFRENSLERSENKQ